MSSIQDDLDSFNQFAIARLSSDPPARSLDELFIEWHDRLARDEVNEAIRRGLADVDAGRVVPADQAMESIREKFGFPKE